MTEIWKDIKDYEGLYQVSNKGRIKRVERDYICKHYAGGNSKYTLKEQILKPRKSNTNYLQVGLVKNKKQKHFSIHKLVANAFIENPNNYKIINHKDSNIENNNVENLEWCTQSYNIQYAYNNKTKTPPNMRKILQLDNEIIINEFTSMMEAQRITGIKYENISKCCRNLRNKAGGYKWAYAE